jgi:tryptophanyl-tRNA synthetase
MRTVNNRIGSENMLNGKKSLFSGMQATGTLHLGNYLGALKNWVEFEDEYECFYCVVDMHSITIRQNPAELRKKARALLTLYIAAGLDPEKNCIYYQSHVPAHGELSWILNCYTYMGELNRMTQYKDKAAKHADNINAGLFTYPILMAADILLFQSDIVPVGDDQKQHIEITRDIAQRFNSIYGDVFTIPEPFIKKSGARVMSLQEPMKKMSKSDENPNASIYLLDDTDTIIRKFKKSVTDSDNQILYSKDKPGISNLIEVYGIASGKTIADIEKEFDGKGYGDFKIAVGEAVANMLRPIQDRYEELSKDKSYIDQIIKSNGEKAEYFANKTLRKVQKKVGFPERIR